MSDGLPTDEQLRRIRAGVMERIDRRRRVRQGVVRSTLAVVLVGGGLGLLVPALNSIPITAGSAAGGGGSAPEAADQGSRSTVTVVCHGVAAGTRITRAKVDPAALPAAAIEACGGAPVAFQADTASSPPTPPPGRLPRSAPAVLCTADDGGMHVFRAGDGGSAACERNGMRLYDR